MSTREAFVTGLMQHYGERGITREMAEGVADQMDEWVWSIGEGGELEPSSPSQQLPPGDTPWSCIFQRKHVSRSSWF